MHLFDGEALGQVVHGLGTVQALFQGKLGVGDLPGGLIDGQAAPLQLLPSVLVEPITMDDK